MKEGKKKENDMWYKLKSCGIYCCLFLFVPCFLSINMFAKDAYDLSKDLIIVDFNQSMQRSKHFKGKNLEMLGDWAKIKGFYEDHIVENYQYSQEPIIPKIIHQIWLGSPFPESYKKLQQTWIKTHPGWEYKLWTDKDIDEFSLKNRKAYDETNNYGVKSDIARYEILYKFGGLYVDTDFECIKSFDILHHICDFYTGAAYGPEVCFFNGLIAAVPGHPVLLECINKIQVRNGRGERFASITKRTGPHYFTRCFLNTIKSHEGPSVIFPITYFYPWPHYYRNVNSRKQVMDWVNPETLAIHHWFVSWKK